MVRTRFVAGIVLIVSGVVWMLQGMNSRYAPRSFMTDSREWILFGAIAVALGVWMTASARRKE
jgi:uncharacterized membrane protein HdeD (DUF308 family)